MTGKAFSLSCRIVYRCSFHYLFVAAETQILYRISGEQCFIIACMRIMTVGTAFLHRRMDGLLFQKILHIVMAGKAEIRWRRKQQVFPVCCVRGVAAGALPFLHRRVDMFSLCLVVIMTGKTEFRFTVTGEQPGIITGMRIVAGDAFLFLHRIVDRRTRLDIIVAVKTDDAVISFGQDEVTKFFGVLSVGFGIRVFGFVAGAAVPFGNRAVNLRLIKEIAMTLTRAGSSRRGKERQDRKQEKEQEWFHYGPCAVFDLLYQRCGGRR